MVQDAAAVVAGDRPWRAGFSHSCGLPTFGVPTKAVEKRKRCGRKKAPLWDFGGGAQSEAETGYQRRKVIQERSR